jgi:hypothetical protein
MPRDILAEWQRQGLAADAVLQAAQRLVNSVAVLWQELGLPMMMIDPNEPVLVPDAGTIARASQALVSRTDYERPLGLPVFLARASVSRSVPVEQFAELTIDEMLQVALPMSTPSSSPLQTRYFFAVRARSTEDTPGVVSALIPLAPAPVPVAPASVSTTVGSSGVELTWSVPGGDLALRRLEPAAITYNVYRLDPDGIAGPLPLNLTPLTTNAYTDTTMIWGETYVYEVRALLAAAPARPARREGEGTRTAELQVVDTYPPSPPSNVIPNRAGSRVALQWTASPSIDIVGYRVYRHAFPAPDVPLRFNPTAPEGDPASTAPMAVGPPPGQDAPVENELIAAGWELITPNPAPFSRFNDPNAEPSVRYVYAVEAVDAAGNLSALAIGTEPGDSDR